MYLLTVQAPDTGLTIPGDLLYENGIYSLEVIATGENYSQNSSFAEITVNRNPAARSIEGIFLDENGAAMADVSVVLIKNTMLKSVYITGTKSDTEGRFSFGKLTPDCNYTIQYEKPGYEFASDQLDVKSGRKNIVIRGTSLGDGPLYLSDKGLIHWKDANSQTVTVYSPYEWNASSGDTWFSFSKDGNELTVTMPENNTGEDRQGTILITSAEYSVVLPVVQEKGEGLDYSKNAGSGGTQNLYLMEKGDAYEVLNFLFGEGAVEHKYFWLFGYKPKAMVESYWKILIGDTKKMSLEDILTAKKELIVLAELRATMMANGVLSDTQRAYCSSVISGYYVAGFFSWNTVNEFVIDFMENVDPLIISQSAYNVAGVAVVDSPAIWDIDAGQALLKDKALENSAKYMLDCIHPEIIKIGNNNDEYASWIHETTHQYYSDNPYKISMKKIENFCNILKHYKSEVEVN